MMGIGESRPSHGRLAMIGASCLSAACIAAVAVARPAPTGVLNRLAVTLLRDAPPDAYYAIPGIAWQKSDGTLEAARAAQRKAPFERRGSLTIAGDQAASTGLLARIVVIGYGESVDTIRLSIPHHYRSFTSLLAREFPAMTVRLIADRCAFDEGGMYDSPGDTYFRVDDADRRSAFVHIQYDPKDRHRSTLLEVSRDDPSAAIKTSQCQRAG